MISFDYPEAAEKSLAQMAVLRNTYEDDETTCLLLLWGFGQAGYQDINVGIRIWLNLMKPVIEIKPYSHFCVTYIYGIVHDDSLSWYE